MNRWLAVVSLALLLPLSPAFAQSMSMGNMTMNQTSTEIVQSAATMNTQTGNIQVRLSWPEPVNATDSKRTTFTIEFLNASTGQKLNAVTYSVHMLLNGASLGHEHELAAIDGIGTVEEKFNSTGTLNLYVEILKVGPASMDQIVQFNIAVMPDFPAAIIALAAAISVVLAVTVTKRNSRPGWINKK